MIVFKCFFLIILMLILKIKKKTNLIYFQVKNILKSNLYYNIKRTRGFDKLMENDIKLFLRVLFNN